MKKYISILLILLLCTGCEVNYNLDIKNSNINENIEFTVTESDYNTYNSAQAEKLTDTMYETFEKQHILVFTNDYNTKHYVTSKRTGNSLKQNYSYTYDYLNFGKSYLINNCFEHYVVLNEDDYFYIKAYGGFNCYYGDTNINIRTNHKVLHNNASSNKDNVYSWKINNKNRDNVNIIFQISKSEIIDNDEATNDFSNNISLYILLVVLVVCVVVAIILYKKFKSKVE